MSFSIQSAVAQAPVLDLNIDNPTRHSEWRLATTKAEYTRVDYAIDPRPRIVASVAALQVFATNNPTAGAGVLQQFINTYSNFIGGYASSDQDLRRGANFLPAVRRHDRINNALFTGYDTRVGKRVLELLGVGVKGPDGIQATERRMLEFDNAKVRPLQNAPIWGQLLLLGFYNQDLAGNANTGLSFALNSFLVGEGFEPVPEFSGPEDDRFNATKAALLSMPSWSSYQTKLAEVEGAAALDDSQLQNSIQQCFVNMGILNQGLISDIQTRMNDDPPTLADAAYNALNQSKVDVTRAEFNAAINAAAGERATINYNTLILLQSTQNKDRNHSYAALANDFSYTLLTANDSLAGVKTGVQIGTGLGLLGVGIAAKDPATTISAVSGLTMSGLGLVEGFGASPPAPEAQIFDEIVGVRSDISQLRTAMNERFSAVEEQLGVVFQTITNSFALLETLIGTQFYDQNILIAENRAALDRIENALWAFSIDSLHQNLAILTDLVLDYRSSNTDLAYSNFTPNFVTASSELFTWNTTTASFDVYAGLDGGLTETANAFETLGIGSIGQHINSLRTFPTHLGLSELSPAIGRVVGASPWTQGAAVYSQLMAENPWYFANQRRGFNTDLEGIIDSGKDLSAMMKSARNQTLFDAIFAGFDAVLADLEAFEESMEQPFMDTTQIPYVDISMGFNQDIGPGFGLSESTLYPVNTIGPYGLVNSFAFGSNTNWDWDYFVEGGRSGNTVAMFMALNENEFSAAPGNSTSYWVAEHTGANFAEFTMYTVISGNQDGLHPEWSITPGRTLKLSFWQSNGSEYYFHDVFNQFDPQDVRDDGVASLFVPFYSIAVQGVVETELWKFLREQMKTGNDLEGLSVVEPFNVVNQTNVTIRVESDKNRSNPSPAFIQVISLWNEYRNDYWTFMGTRTSELNSMQARLDDWKALLDAYATMGLPEMMEQSSVAQSAMRGVDSASVDSLNLSFDLATQYEYYGSGLPVDFVDMPVQRLLESTTITKDTVDNYLAQPAQGHGYLAWMIAELEELKENALKLTIDDRYLSGPQLAVNAANGLLANDIDQPERIGAVDHPRISVDVASVVQPGYGSVVVQPDGSFNFTADHALAGTTSFLYRTTRDVNGAPVYSDFATVVIQVTQDLLTFIRVPDDCPTINQALSLIADNPSSVIELAQGVHSADFIFGEVKRFTMRSEDPSDPAVVNATVVDAAGGSVIALGPDLTLGSDTVFDGITFANSSSTAFSFANASPTFRRCWFVNNQALINYGGAFFLDEGSDPIIDSCVFIGNSAPASGGAIYGTGNSLPRVTNSVFMNNSAPDAGAIRMEGSHVKIANCTFYNNTGNAITTGDGIYARIENSIFRGNTPAQVVFEQAWSGHLRYCNIEGGQPTDSFGPGNIDVDPMFVNAVAGNLRLAAGSPCIDAGENSAIGLAGITTDLDGNPRFIDDPDTQDTGSGTTPIVDMGAYEYPGADPCPADTNGDGILDLGDITTFVQLFLDSDISADMNGDGILDLGDIGTFVDAFLAGC